MVNDTIAAVATALSNSGIGIIRISGEAAIETADRIFRPAGKEKRLSDQKSYTAHYGYIFDGEEKIDEVIVILMRAPHSYTTEDTVEINCHGGVLVVKKVLETVIKNGARLAQPGEFTKRAFLNGRIDLSQAEAVADLISSKNEYALKSSVSQLGGALSKLVREIREKILYEIAYIESALDDPEHISLEGYPEHLRQVICPIKSELEKAVSSSENGRILKEGIRTVILGKPNAGKSSLMNVLLGEERAIVTDIAGTTRDTLEENIRLKGLSLNLIDTAGIRETEDLVEQIGVERARKIADDADLLIYVVDGSCPFDENDEQIIELIKGRRVIVILNKTDLEQVISEEEAEKKTGCSVIPVSAKEQTGIEFLEQKIEDLFFDRKIDFNDEVLITNMRHKAALADSVKSLELVEKSIDDEMPEDFYSIDLMNAYESLSTIIGESLEDDLVNEIFSRFCMGK